MHKMRKKIGFKCSQTHNNTERRKNTKAKNVITYYSNIAITAIITLIAFVMLLITLTSSNSDAFNDDKATYQQSEDQAIYSSTTTFNDNDIENVISATPNKNNSSAFTNTLTQQTARGHWDNKRHQSVSVKLKDDDGHNGFYDKINTSNQSNEFNRFSTPTKSASVKFFEDIELQESLSLSSSSSSSRTSSYHKQLLLLHRNKRYLVFPKGSSFQLIFDLIIGIVDYTSYAILGITCAVAWELPDKPPSELIEDVQLRLNEGTLGLRRNDSTQTTQLKYVDKAIAASESKTTQQQQQQLDGNYKAKMSAIFADAEQQKPMATTSYYNNNNMWAKKPSVTFNRPLPAYNANHPYNNNNNYYKNYYYAGEHDKSGNSKSSLLQGDTALNNKVATHLNTHAADYYYNNNNNNKRTYNGVKSTTGNMNTVGRKKYADWNRKDSWYDDSKYNKYATNKRTHWWAQNADRKQNAWQRRQQQWASKYEQSPQQLNAPITSYNAPIYTAEGRTGRARQILQPPPKHHIYPVFGKKRRRRHDDVNNDVTDFENKLASVHLKAHLQSRQLLYEKIEKLYKVRGGGHNGTECVLRAICETAERQQQQQQSEPQSFISELLRVIFSMPQDMQQHHIEARQIAGHFRDAHAVATDCEFRYAQCGHSIWSDFKFGMKM